MQNVERTPIASVLSLEENRLSVQKTANMALKLIKSCLGFFKDMFNK